MFSPRLSQGMTGGHGLGMVCGHTKAFGLFLFPHQSSISDEGLQGWHAVSMLGRTLALSDVKVSQKLAQPKITHNIIWNNLMVTGILHCGKKIQDENNSWPSAIFHTLQPNGQPPTSLLGHMAFHRDGLDRLIARHALHNSITNTYAWQPFSVYNYCKYEEEVRQSQNVTISQTCVHILLYGITSFVAVPSYFPKKVSCTCSSQYLTPVRALYPSQMIFSLPFGWPLWPWTVGQAEEIAMVASQSRQLTTTTA